MNFGNIIVIVLLTFYTNHILHMLFNKNMRKKVQITNIKLEKLRTVPIKTLEEQKQFINLKFPKRAGKFKFRWIIIPNLLLTILIYVIIFNIFLYLFNIININLDLWQGILFAILFPLLINLILEKFNIQKNDLSVMFRK